MVKVDCPDCSTSIIKSYDAEVKLRAKVIKWTKEGMFAICKSCKQDVPIDMDVLKSIQSTFIYEIDEDIRRRILSRCK